MELGQNLISHYSTGKIPKRNMVRIGFDWLRVMEKIVETPYQFLKRYFKMNKIK